MLLVAIELNMKALDIKEYLDEIKPYLNVLINNFECKVQLNIRINSFFPKDSDETRTMDRKRYDINYDRHWNRSLILFYKNMQQN